MHNVHERHLPAPPSQLAPLIDGLAGPDDRLWARHRWPAMRFDRGLAVGARGGHGPVRYRVEEHQPGSRARFRFTEALDGTHEFELVADGNGGSVLRHVLQARARGWMVIGWPLAFRWMHDAAVEDSLDLAEAAARGEPYEPRRLGLWVRLLRRVARRLV